MSVRLSEIHPSIVHFPIALYPTAIVADLLGRVRDSDALAEAGRVLMPIAVASGVVAAAAGLLAQEEANVEGEAYDVLATHRTLNQGLVALTGAMALWRWRRREPGAGYLALGLGALAAMGYSAYLGGKLTYEHGVGVKPADGLKDGDSPELAPGQFGEAARRTVADMQRGIQRVVEDTKEGRLVPALGRNVENPGAFPPGPSSVGGGARLRDEGPGAPESIP